MIVRAMDATFRGTKDVSARERARLHRYLRCARPRVNRVRMRSVLKHDSSTWWTRRHPPPPTLFGPVTASWFYDAGATACGFHATYGFATLIGVWCGGHVLMQGPSGAIIDAVREDSGPYVYGRTFDLNPSLRDALGCGDICSVRYRVL